ncbi:hypothetical protein [Kineosporia babensis]|uniref:Uncharacterized protein n=1 Tax=Kineosporia babensis TaxID=499548 RepID=A0A9X1NJU4_9ACTN|nr:hypothetical protein [Kineosporia babensis]MCD5316322.1 hypothetical protein [Kineosporia babensis]
MTDWSRLRHAHGSAQDIPGRLEQLSTQPRAELWNDLWSALCHQGEVYDASFAALPALARIAAGSDREPAVNAIVLAAAIVAAAENPIEHPAQLQVAAERQLHARRCAPLEYIYLLAAMLTFEGEVHWNEDLPAGLSDGEYELTCPECDAELLMVLDERGFYAADAEDESRTTPLRPSDAGKLEGQGRRLHDLAASDGQHEIAGMLTYVFGEADCPCCAAGFVVTEHIGIPYDGTDGLNEE